MCGQLLLLFTTVLLTLGLNHLVAAMIFWSKLFFWVFEDCHKAQGRKNILFLPWAHSPCYLSLQQGMWGTLHCSLHCYSRTPPLPCAFSMALEHPTAALQSLSRTPPLPCAVSITLEHPTAALHSLSSSSRLSITSQTGCNPQVFLQLKRMCMDTTLQLFLSAD